MIPQKGSYLLVPLETYNVEPQQIAKVLNITPIARVYDTYNIL